jgi:GT2 family glycosyltransferase
MTTVANLAVIIVSWNVRDLLQRCLRTVRHSLHQGGMQATIIVVDNASTDGTPAMLRAEFPDVFLIEPQRNLGFAGGNNAALRPILENRLTLLFPVAPADPPDYLLLLNPDTEVLEDAIPRMVHYLDRNPDVALVGPRLITPEGDTQPSRRRFPLDQTFVYEGTPLEQIQPQNRFVQRYRYADRPDDTLTQEVEWLEGAALMIRRSVIERAGLMDAGFELFSEELEWQWRIRRTAQRAAQGMAKAPMPWSKIVYLPAAEIIHYGGKSSEQTPARRYITFQQSRIRYARMVFGPRAAAKLRNALRLQYIAELGVEALKWLLGHRRKLRAQRIGVYREVLRNI